MAFHSAIKCNDGQWDFDSVLQLVQGLPSCVRDLLQDCDPEEPFQESLGRLQDAIGSLDGSQQAYQQALHKVKKYKQRLRKAKKLTKICEVYEEADPDPIVAPEITEPAPVTRRKTIRKFMKLHLEALESYVAQEAEIDLRAETQTHKKRKIVEVDLT